MKLAAWLLERFGVPRRNEALVGDLAEERARGRSALWLWGQTLAAIGDTVARELGEHWLLGLRAVAVAWTVLYLLSHVVFLWERAHRAEYWLKPYPNPMWLVIEPYAVTVLAGMAVAATHRSRQAAMVLAYSASFAIFGAWSWMHLPQLQYLRTVAGRTCEFIFYSALGGFLIPLRRTSPPKRTGLRIPIP